MLHIWSSWKAGTAYLTKGTWKSHSCHGLCIPAVWTLSYITGVAIDFCKGYTCASLLIAPSASPNLSLVLCPPDAFYWIETSFKMVCWDQFLDHRQKGWMKKGDENSLDRGVRWVRICLDNLHARQGLVSRPRSEVTAREAVLRLRISAPTWIFVTCSSFIYDADDANIPQI